MLILLPDLPQRQSKRCFRTASSVFPLQKGTSVPASEVIPPHALCEQHVPPTASPADTGASCVHVLLECVCQATREGVIAAPCASHAGGNQSLTTGTARGTHSGGGARTSTPASWTRRVGVLSLHPHLLSCGPPSCSSP